MDVWGLAATLISLIIFAFALYEGLVVARLIGRIPRFWAFFLAAILFLVLRRALVLFSAALAVPLPSYWSSLDADATPIIFSALLLLWVYDMRRSFQRATPKPAQTELPAPKQV